MTKEEIEDILFNALRIHNATPDNSPYLDYRLPYYYKGSYLKLGYNPTPAQISQAFDFLKDICDIVNKYFSDKIKFMNQLLVCRGLKISFRKVSKIVEMRTSIKYSYEYCRKLFNKIIDYIESEINLSKYHALY